MGYDLVHAGFVGRLIYLHKRYPTILRRTLTDLLGIRDKADCWIASVSQREAAQAVRRAQEFVHEVKAHRLLPQGERI